MKSLLRKSKDKDKSKGTAARSTPDVAPMLKLSGVDDSPLPERPLLQSGLIGSSPSVASFTSFTSSNAASGSGSPPPLYARFARSSALDFNDASSIRSGGGSSLLSPPLSPPHTLKHRPSNESGFRSRDEVERLTVVRRDRDRGRSPSASDGDSQTRPSFSRAATSDGTSSKKAPVIQPILPRPPTPPPPSPPKPVYAKLAPAPPVTPTKTKIPVASASLPLPSPSQTFAPPSSPPGSLATRRAYSPLAAFYAKPAPIINATPSSPPNTLATLPPGAAKPTPPSALSRATSPTPSGRAISPVSSVNRAASPISSVNGSARAVSPVRNGSASASMGGMSGTDTEDDEKKVTAKGLRRGSYFASYPARTLGSPQSSTSLASNASASASANGNANGSVNGHEVRIIHLTTTSYNDTNNTSPRVSQTSSPTKRTLVPNTSLTIELKGTGADEVEPDVPTPRATAYAPSTPPSNSSASKDKGNAANVAEDEDPALKAFAATLPASMISNLGNSTTPVRASRVRTSRQAIPGAFNGANGHANNTSNGDAHINGIEKKEDKDTGSVSNPSPTTPSRIPLPVPIPSTEERIATLSRKSSYDLGISRSATPNGSKSRSETPNGSVPGTPTKGTLNRGVSGMGGVRERIRMLEEAERIERKVGGVGRKWWGGWYGSGSEEWC
ncbi:hypothetical protein M422DRAFT_50068 [Sphaerobolus stellatus SS14]|uniref:Unplaced genomic scaffold SPHSTscaffold_86, whole genome shotgun sequence n=1 Tax=Sphaerobolus stellatus (strain SS14) TaxID=990650 RepID=A0A0C9VLB5_SPHS4|nr:hypothetical protein M422DRAFT_50068 [Sphaerobolus stellatus SS14]